MLHSMYLLFLILSLNSTFLAFEPGENNNIKNVKKEKQVDSNVQSSIFQASQDKKILFALHIKKRIKQDLVEEETVSLEEIDSCNKNPNENDQESFLAKLKKKLQKLREKLQPRKHAMVAESIALGLATSGAGTTVTGFGVAGT
ncbi:hypothetical protein HYV10_03925, partial [Candidatus Dependentiae bacterium]|nr:hypothetical protein [Candidatus Dependentiae bacterium]